MKVGSVHCSAQGCLWIDVLGGRGCETVTPLQHIIIIIIIIIVIIIIPVTTLCTVFAAMYHKQTLFLQYTVLQLFCMYSLCYM